MEKGKKENRKDIVLTDDIRIDENSLFSRISEIIENRRSRAGVYANREVTLMYWEIGRYINDVLLENERAVYGKKIFVSLSRKLTDTYGRNFDDKNLYRMVQFANTYSDTNVVSGLATSLSWSHIIQLLPLDSEEARSYYANDACTRHLGVRELRRQISRKAYERQEIADTRVSADSAVPFNMFKDPYLLDAFGLKDNFLEADLENAILTELERFILEFGHGFTFVERQKRMTMDGEDYSLDLLFYHRALRRLVAFELKVGKFKPEYAGQMQFYLNWLNEYERQAGENEPIGLILCTKASRNQIELMRLDRSGIAVAEYWTALPPKTLLEKKIRTILAEAKEISERRRTLPKGIDRKCVNYFLESKDDADE